MTYEEADQKLIDMGLEADRTFNYYTFHFPKNRFIVYLYDYPQDQLEEALENIRQIIRNIIDP